MSTESTFRYNGPLSTYQEWDALLYGLVVGAAFSFDTVRRDIRAEPSKLIAGALLAYALARGSRS
ncbi:MAG: hypothetical protein V5A34_05675 [Halapricum sp.]